MFDVSRPSQTHTQIMVHIGGLTLFLCGPAVCVCVNPCVICLWIYSLKFKCAFWLSKGILCQQLILVTFVQFRHVELPKQDNEKVFPRTNDPWKSTGKKGPHSESPWLLRRVGSRFGTAGHVERQKFARPVDGKIREDGETMGRLITE